MESKSLTYEKLHKIGVLVFKQLDRTSYYYYRSKIRKTYFTEGGFQIPK
jgi:hypothetical protein